DRLVNLIGRSGNGEETYSFHLVRIRVNLQNFSGDQQNAYIDERRTELQAAIKTACAFAGSSSAGAIKLRKLRRSSDSSRTSASSSSAATKQVSDKSTSDAAFDVTRALIKTAKALARSHSTSEVLTLNLTNLLILRQSFSESDCSTLVESVSREIMVVIKAEVGGPGHGRSLVEKSKPFMSQGELLLVMTYILGAAENDNYECMYRVACEDPNQAKDYLKASQRCIHDLESTAPNKIVTPTLVTHQDSNTLPGPHVMACSFSTKLRPMTWTHNLRLR
ncbi:hypothetical protein Ocin01_19836, partial [Orchesella cincta]